MADTSKIPNRMNWFLCDKDSSPDGLLSLSTLTSMYISYMLIRTLNMFDYEGLPEGITDKDMERFTQIEGKQFFFKHKDRYYILPGSFVDTDVNWNHEAKLVVLASADPKLEFYNATLKIGEECVLFPNDRYYIGLMPLFRSNALQLAHVDISINYACFNVRLKTVFTADDDDTAKSIDEMLEKVWKGEKITSILTDDLYKNSVEGISYGDRANNDLKQLIELKQYIKANWYMDLGINANYNMKREAINESETELNDDALMPLIDDMLKARKEAVEAINKLYGLNISVDYSSAWKKLREEIELNVEAKKAEVEAVEKATEEPDEPEEPKEKAGDSDDNKEA